MPINHKERRSFWYPMVKSLVDYLTAQTETNASGATVPLFDGVSIYAGTKGKARDYPCIEITWDEEQGISLNRSVTGSITLWIDVCVKGDDKEPGSAYALQDELQNKILSRLWGFAPYARDETGVGPNVTLDGILSDGDIYRPVSVARIVLDIEWRK